MTDEQRRDAEWFAANDGALPDEERFRAIAREREAAAWDAFHTTTGLWDEPDIQPGYGLPFGDMHPFDFRPDLDCCDRSERASWVAACLAAEAGLPFETGNHHHAFTDDGDIVIGGTVSSWGIGVFVYRRIVAAAG